MKALLLILDGAGYASPAPGNAVTAETMPFLFSLMEENGFAVLDASGQAVGLESDQVGNSEIGHLTIGAGQRVPSTLNRIDSAFRDGSWEQQALWKELAKQPVLHITGLLSEAGVHGHWQSLYQAAAIASRQGIRNIYVHPLLDGVDSQKGTAPRLLEALSGALKPLAGVSLGVVMGRRWFCDRSGDLGITAVFRDGLLGRTALPPFSMEVLEAHLRQAGEAELPAHLCPEGRAIKEGEAVLITSHRADRTRQAAQLLGETQPLAALIELKGALSNDRVFFPTSPLKDGLGFTLKKAGISSIRIAEQCKFPHVTFFMNGLNEALEGKAIAIPSIPESAIAQQPEMSLSEVTKYILAALEDQGNRAVVANIANLDQVGHLGDVKTAKIAAKHVDIALRQIAEQCRNKGWTLLITSDHGNADEMLDTAGRPNGSHSHRPVPFISVPAPNFKMSWVARQGSLANVAATYLTALGLVPPTSMEPSLLRNS